METAVAVTVPYRPFFHKAFNTRSLEIWHFGVGAMPFAVFNLLFDEGRKFFMRRAGFGLANTVTKTDSWYMGSNVDGKPRRLLSYIGGVGNYRQKCEDLAREGYPGFVMQ